MPKIIITPAQALLKLIKLEKDQKKIEYYSKLLVVGAHAMADEKESSQDPYANLKKLINMLQSHPDLSQYEIVADIVSISNDPCVREFQTHSAFETIPKTLECLDLALLESHYTALFNLLKPHYQTDSNMRGVLHGDNALKTVNKGNSLAFAHIQWNLKQDTSFSHFSDIQKQKMKHLLNIAFLSCELDEGKHIDNIPLKIYGRGVFSPESRGLEHKSFSVLSDNLGLRRFKDPRIGHTFVRQYPSDVGCYAKQNWFNPFAAYPKQLLQSGIAPFINSLSGTTLASLRLMLYLHHNKLFEINAEYLDRFIKSAVSVRTFCVGGHSIQESFDVVTLKSVKAAFSSISDLKKATLDVFYEENKKEIITAAIVAANYTQQYLGRVLLHQDIQAVSKPSDIKLGMIPSKMEEKKESKSLFERTREAVNSYHAGSLKRLIAEYHDNFASLLAAEEEKNNLTELFRGALEMEVDEIIKILMANLPVHVVINARKLVDLKCGYKIVAYVYRHDDKGLFRKLTSLLPKLTKTQLEVLLILNTTSIPQLIEDIETKDPLLLLADHVLKMGDSFHITFYAKFNVEDVFGKKYFGMLKKSVVPHTINKEYAPYFIACMVEIYIAIVHGKLSDLQKDQCAIVLMVEINMAFDNNNIGAIFRCPRKAISTIIEKSFHVSEEKKPSSESLQPFSPATDQTEVYSRDRTEAKVARSMQTPEQRLYATLLAELGTDIAQGAEEKLKRFFASHLRVISIRYNFDNTDAPLLVLQDQFSIEKYKNCFNKLRLEKTKIEISTLLTTKDFWISSVDTVSPLQIFIASLYDIESQANGELRKSRMGYYTMLFFIDKMLIEKNTPVPLRIEILITIMKFAEKLVIPKKLGFYNSFESENQSIILLKQATAALLEIFPVELPKHMAEPTMARQRL